jgi:hypothetical protein
VAIHFITKHKLTLFSQGDEVLRNQGATGEQASGKQSRLQMISLDII